MCAKSGDHRVLKNIGVSQRSCLTEQTGSQMLIRPHGRRAGAKWRVCAFRDAAEWRITRSPFPVCLTDFLAILETVWYDCWRLQFSSRAAAPSVVSTASTLPLAIRVTCRSRRAHTHTHTQITLVCCPYFSKGQYGRSQILDFLLAPMETGTTSPLRFF